MTAHWTRHTFQQGMEVSSVHRTRPMTSTVRRFARPLPVLLLGRPLHGAERHRPFFIVGSGRCGSTLLRAMLEAHPDVHVPPESRLGPVLGDYRRYSRLPWNALL